MEVVHPLELQDFWQHQLLGELSVTQLLGLWGHWWCQVCRDMGWSAVEVMAISVSFFEPLVAGDQKASLASLSVYLCLPRHLEGSLPGNFLCCSAYQAHRGVTVGGVLLCSSAHQEFDGPASLVHLLTPGVGKERLW